MATNGWISEEAMAPGALEASTEGRQVMQSDYIQTNHIEDGAITLSKIGDPSIFYTGVYGVSVYGGATYG